MATEAPIKNHPLSFYYKRYLHTFRYHLCACVKFVLTFDVRVPSLYVIPDGYGEKKQCTYGIFARFKTQPKRSVYLRI